MNQTNPIDKGLEEIIKETDQKFQEEFMADGELLVPEDVDDAQDIRDFIKSSLTLAYTRGLESVKSLKI